MDKLLIRLLLRDVLQRAKLQINRYISIMIANDN